HTHAPAPPPGGGGGGGGGGGRGSQSARAHYYEPAGADDFDDDRAIAALPNPPLLNPTLNRTRWLGPLPRMCLPPTRRAHPTPPPLPPFGPAPPHACVSPPPAAPTPPPPPPPPAPLPLAGWGAPPVASPSPPPPVDSGGNVIRHRGFHNECGCGGPARIDEAR